MNKRILAVLLAALMLLSMLPVSAATASYRCPYCGKKSFEIFEPVYQSCTRSTYAGGYCHSCMMQGSIELPALGHDWGEWYILVNGDCTHEGERVRYCKRCQASDRQTFAGGHDFSWTIYPPNCTEPGKRVGVCDRCGHIWEGINEDQPAHGHKMGPWTVVEYATPASDGRLESVCSVCGYTEEDTYSISISDVTVRKGVDDNRVRTEGEEITYVFSITNDGPETVYDVTVTDPLKGGSEDAVAAFIPELASGESASDSFTYTVTAEDVKRGYVENTAYATWGNMIELPVPDKDGETTQYVGGETETNSVVVNTRREETADHLTVNKRAYILPGFFVEGGWAIVYVDVTNNTDDFIYLTGGLWDHIVETDHDYELESGGLHGHNSAYSTLIYVITAEDVERGYVSDYAYANYTYKGKEYTAYSNTVVLSNEETGITKSEICVPDNGAYYVPGEEVIFRFDFTNVESHDLEGTFEDVCSETGEVIWSEEVSVPAGETVYRSVSHIVTEEDAQRGCFTDFGRYMANGNTYTSNKVTVECGMPGSVTVEKVLTNAPANGVYFTEGETATFDITISTAKDIILTYIGDYIVERDEDMVLLDGNVYLSAGSTETVHDVKYIVSKADARRGYAEDVARVRYSITEDGEETEILSAPVVITCDMEADNGITLTKVLNNAPANGAYFVPGESAHFDITINLPAEVIYALKGLTDCVVDTGMEETLKLKEDEPLVLAGMTDITYQVSYIVSNADAIRGSVTDIAYAYLLDWNDVTAAGSDTLDSVPEIMVSSEPVTIICGDPIKQIDLVKEIVSEPADGIAYTRGEEVIYKIVATNHTGLTLFDVELGDVIEDEFYSCDMIDVMEPGDTVTSYGSYIVTDDDVKRAFVTDYAYARWLNTDGLYYLNYSNTCSVRTDGPIGNVRVEKEIINVPVNGAYYTEGEIIDYRVTVYNEYEDTDVVDITVNDEYIGISENVDVIYAGQYVVIEFSHIVTAEEAEYGSIYNQAYASFIPYEAPEYKTVFSNPVTAPTGKLPERPDFSAGIKKQVVSVPANGMYYVPGETVYYLVSVTNTGIVPFSETDIFDVMFTHDGNIENDYAYTYMLEPGETASHVFEYTVTIEDAPMGMLYDSAYSIVYSEEGCLTVYSHECAVPVGYGDIMEHHGAEVFKYVSSTPANGAYYTEGEKIVFTVIGIPNEETIIDIDDILIGVPGCIMIKDMDTSFMMGIECWNVEYIVTAADCVNGKVTNTAWIVAETYEGYQHMEYSNEVEVPCGDGSYVSPFGSNCEKTLVAASDSSELIRTDMCAHHSVVEMAAMSLDSDKERVDMWTRELYTMYSALIKTTGDTALETDRANFMSYIGSLRKVLGDEKVVELMRERTTELCCESAKSTRLDLHTQPAAELENHADCMNNCASIVKSFNGTSYTTETITAGAHRVSADKVYNLMPLLKNDESMYEAVWGFAEQIWQNDLTAQINNMMSKNVTAAVSAKAMATATLSARKAALAAIYSEDPAVAAELFVREVKNMVVMYCENVMN